MFSYDIKADKYLRSGVSPGGGVREVARAVSKNVKQGATAPSEIALL